VKMEADWEDAPRAKECQRTESGRSRGNTSLLTPGSQALASRNENKSLLKPLVCSPLLWQPQGTSTPNTIICNAPGIITLQGHCAHCTAKKLRPGRRNWGQDPEEGSHRARIGGTHVSAKSNWEAKQKSRPSIGFSLVEAALVSETRDCDLRPQTLPGQAPRAPDDSVQSWSTKPAPHSAL